MTTVTKKVETQVKQTINKPIDKVEQARKDLVLTEAKIKETEAELEKLKDKVKELNAIIPPPRQASLKECLNQQNESRLAASAKRKEQEEAIKRVLRAT